jgi:tRNA (guanine37-N1)-methyltransferase
MVAPPVYSRPAEFRGMQVPEILLSGHEAKIEEWRLQQALDRTKQRRPELYEKIVKKKP